jgi:virginiamycin B lyase
MADGTILIANVGGRCGQPRVYSRTTGRRGQMLSRQSFKVTVAALAMPAYFLPISVAEDAIPTVQVKSTISQTCESAHVGFGAFWMLSGNNLNRIDFRDNSVRQVLVKGLQSWHSSVTVGDGAVWLGDARSTIYKVDPENERVINEVRVELDQSSTATWDLAVGESAVWVVVGNKKLGRYSTISGAEEATISLPSSSSRVLLAFGFVWVSGTGNDKLYRVDPATNQIAATIELRARPKALAAEEGAIWVFNEGEGTIQRIDGKSGEQLASIATDTVGRANLTVGGGFVWVGTASGAIMQIDPRTNSVGGKFRAEAGDYYAIGYGDDSLRMCGMTAYRIAPPR